MTESTHEQRYCYLIELTGNNHSELLASLSAEERQIGDWERVYSAKLPTWRLWSDENADTIRYVVSHVIARYSLPQNDYWLIQYEGNDHRHPTMLHPRFHTR
ncbi:hypothetical protein RA086_01210 [Lactiplantibacillus sp. WILCCON 0030]|uniref:Uncharacterized protein n=2 Tax=Lactiplantibacillus brownii TaxID=3069269 RepID=A0ABU1A5L2_9LACO|nr:hypothetical protein [Lactiplantibacillus brownii]MDQ7936269.1 hypothetical protein [Lactiplantibacillus brownii]